MSLDTLKAAAMTHLGKPGLMEAKVLDLLGRLETAVQQSEDAAAVLMQLAEHRCQCGGHERKAVHVCTGCGGRCEP